MRNAGSTGGARRTTPSATPRSGEPSWPASEHVTVVIPAHNEAGYLEAALASVVAQDYPMSCLDCVTVDNASVDGTRHVAMEFAARHRELGMVVVAEPSLGVARAKNRGALQATGAILVFLDADSRMTAHLMRDIVTHYHAGAPAGSIRIVADSDSRLERGFFDLMEVGSVLFGIRSQMFYCDRALFLALGGFDEELRLAEDLAFLRRVREYVRSNGMGTLSHIRTSTIATSPRRLRTLPAHLGIVRVFARWALAFAGVGRKRAYD